jgi:hypothetical protein
MNRRDVLKLISTFSLTGLASLAAPLQALGAPAAEPERSFQGTADGKIYISEDGGDRWRLAANFGQGYPVHRIFFEGGYIHVNLGAPGRQFYLKSVDGRKWYTADYPL